MSGSHAVAVHLFGPTPGSGCPPAHSTEPCTPCRQTPMGQTLQLLVWAAVATVASRAAAAVAWVASPSDSLRKKEASFETVTKFSTGASSNS